MENRKQVGSSSSSSSSSSSFTVDLFGPKKDSSSTATSTSTSLFGSVFGPSSTGLGRDSSHFKYAGSSRKQDSKHATPDNSKTQRSKDSKERSSVYQTETIEPCYFSSSIYYGGQEVYSPNSQTTTSQQHIFKKEGDEDPNESNANDALRGNWWQGSLYY